MWLEFELKANSLISLSGILLLAVSTSAFNAQTTERTIYSPDNTVQLVLTFIEHENGRTEMTYQVSKSGKVVVRTSALALELDNHFSEWALAIKNTPTGPWMENLALKEVQEFSESTQWKPVYGERSIAKDHYNSMIFAFMQKDNPNYSMNIEARVYDAGIAFRYRFPDNPIGIYYRIFAECSEFSFPEDTLAWHTLWAQGMAEKRTLKDWVHESERRLTLELANGLYVSLGEAAVVDYLRTKFELSSKKADTLVTRMHHPVDLIPGTNTPWRVIMVVETAALLLANNDIFLNLNEPSKITSTHWIKPGKIERDMTLSEEGSTAWIDFAAEHNLKYILFDWKWYGPSFTFESDASNVAIDLDLKKVIEYGKSKGVGIWVYVNQQALLAQDAEIFPLYKEWGLAGVKYGFVQVGSRCRTTWLHDSIQRAAENELMVNIHDEFRVTGEQRTWPNIMTVEGIFEPKR